ncbi:MAG: phenylalanine--tRNA ligase subunit alpha [Chloroflexi bacterium RBG_16_60_22]|nr:MAG: phenylalanine--tRNA ligase subunit alpha [Chloroflexi bacterium RBG_16_60_22]
MIEKIEAIKAEALEKLGSIGDVKELEAWRVRYLGKKSPLTGILRGLAALSLEERKAAGAAANRLKNLLETSAEQKSQQLRDARLTSAAQEEAIDISLPGRPYPVGRRHPITQTINEICGIFVSMGFQVLEGPDVELDYYNFEALNIPAEHPSRDSMSTFWVDTKKDGKRPLLRTHTTAVTARTLERLEPPIRAVEVGKVYRYEATDATHLSIYYNIDGIAVDKGITMADLKGTLYEFARRFFGEDRKVRFRADYFPFVEPGVEMAIECLACRGAGCRLCGSSGWLEILGAGMTHPDVLRRGGIDPKVYSSYAFGIGIDRLPMLRYGIDDIRHFYNNDLRFLRQF